MTTKQRAYLLEYAIILAGRVIDGNPSFLPSEYFRDPRRMAGVSIDEMHNALDDFLNDVMCREEADDEIRLSLDDDDDDAPVAEAEAK